jgi:hypothetical protein
MEVDANGLLFAGDATSVVLQSEAEVHLHEGGATGEFVLKPQEKRHFVVTAMNGRDPEIPEIRTTEADWEVDGTIDFWVQWTLRCPFQGVQRTHVLRLASLLRSVFVTPGHQRGALRETLYGSPYLLLAPVALAAWGWEEELAGALSAWQPDPEDALDRQQAAWLVWGLAAAQASGLVEGTLVVPHWNKLRPMVDALAMHAGGGEPVATVAGLRAALALADELMLEGDASAWETGVATAQGGLADGEKSDFRGAALRLGGIDTSHDEPVAAVDRTWRVRQELTWGGYLQARRQMDTLLQAYGPLGTVEGTAPNHPDLGEWALVLWTAAEIYLQGAPTPERVHLEGDLGD